MTFRSNDEWLADLRATDDRRESALADLRALILRGLPFALGGKLSPEHPALDALTEDVAQETLLKVLTHLDSFEGRSLFVTWVQKIAVREALGELRRRRWQDVPLPEMTTADDDNAPMLKWLPTSRLQNRRPSAASTCVQIAVNITRRSNGC